jgi:hypothetical protein
MSDNNTILLLESSVTSLLEGGIFSILRNMNPNIFHEMKFGQF